MPDFASLAALLVLAGLTLYAAIVDFRWLIIPDAVNLAIFGTGLAASFLPGFPGPVSALAATLLGGGLLFLLQAAFRAYRGYDGIGLGDVKFVAAAGSWAGLEGLAGALCLGSFSALCYLFGRRAADSGFDIRQPLPFGPFLGLGVVAIVGLRIATGLTMVDLADLLLLRFTP